MSYLKINNTDVSNLVKELKIGYEVLVADSSGRNANGDTVIDIRNRKTKVYVRFRTMDDSEMQYLLSLVEDFVIPVTFLDSKTKSLKTITCYIGTPEPDYYSINDKIYYKPMDLNFIEL